MATAPLQEIQREHLKLPYQVFNMAAYVIITDEANGQFRVLKERIDITNIINLMPIDDSLTYSMEHFEHYLETTRTLKYDRHDWIV